MKNLIWLIVLPALLVSPSLAGDSPIDQGSIRLGGTAFFMKLSGEFYGDDCDGVTAVTVIPAFEYFISPKLSLGFDMLYLNLSADSDYLDDEYDISGTGFGPTIGYYFGNIDSLQSYRGKIYPYVKGFFSFLSVEVNDYDGKMKSLGGKFGVNYLVTDYVILDFGVRFSFDSIKVGRNGYYGDSQSGNNLWIGGGIFSAIW